MNRATLQSVAWCLAGLTLFGCKGTQDHLFDLTEGRAITRRGVLSEGTYDAGQLVHESFAGLLEADEFTTRDLARSIASAGWIVRNNEIPLLRANALAFMSHAVRRFPLPAAAEALEVRETEDVLALLGEIEEAEAPLEPANLIIDAQSPDRVVALRAFDLLRELTGEDFGDDAQAWITWWEANTSTFEAEVDSSSIGPLEVFARLRVPGSTPELRLSIGSGFLRVIARGNFYRPALRDLRRRVVVNLGRQVVVAAIVTTLERAATRPPRDGNPGTFDVQRSELDLIQAAESARLIRDPEFEDALLKAIRWGMSFQAGSGVMTSLFKAIAFYPSADAIALAIENLASPFPPIVAQAHRVLVQMSGEDFGLDRRDWRDWWQRSGSRRWKVGT